MNVACLNGEPEVFYSLQGEGTTVGSPTVFVRLAGCNLHCSWCDTKYSWGKGIALSEEDVAARVLHFPAPRLVLTGGEPLLQAQDIASLLNLLPSHFTIEVESNGTLLPPPQLLARVSQWNISPKLTHADSGPASLCPKVLDTFASLPNAWFKFVVRSEADWSQIAALRLPHDRILLMPCAASRSFYRRLLPTVAAMCLAHGTRLSPRLHIELWNSRPGV